MKTDTPFDVTKPKIGTLVSTRDTYNTKAWGGGVCWGCPELRNKEYDKHPNYLYLGYVKGEFFKEIDNNLLTNPRPKGSSDVAKNRCRVTKQNLSIISTRKQNGNKSLWAPNHIGGNQRNIIHCVFRPVQHSCKPGHTTKANWWKGRFWDTCSSYNYSYWWLRNSPGGPDEAEQCQKMLRDGTGFGMPTSWS